MISNNLKLQLYNNFIQPVVMYINIGYYSNMNKINFLLSKEKNQEESLGHIGMKIPDN